MSAYERNSRHLREVLIFCFNMKKSAAEAHRMLSNTYAACKAKTEGISASHCNWFEKWVRYDNPKRRKSWGYPGHVDGQTEYSRFQGHAQYWVGPARRSHDNARPHVAKVVKTYLETLKWEVLLHPLYSPDLAPSDYHLFRSMAHGLADQHFRSYEKIDVMVAERYWSRIRGWRFRVVGSDPSAPENQPSRKAD
ncbi:mariner Mos1 transposase [Trichonephila clavipes]|uniref:Mariner Mos1 transposase n=1 Tax=Trichonephila clavipes TaxID=2585209 RepID=A0A8X6S3S6_TRICX|nr:mariner Mos1 transposase [Trichonephila clavipes]